MAKATEATRVRTICPACGAGMNDVDATDFFETRGPQFAEELAGIGRAITASASFVLSWAELHERLGRPDRTVRRQRRVGG